MAGPSVDKMLSKDDSFFDQFVDQLADVNMLRHKINDNDDNYYNYDNCILAVKTWACWGKSICERITYYSIS